MYQGRASRLEAIGLEAARELELRFPVDVDTCEGIYFEVEGTKIKLYEIYQEDSMGYRTDQVLHWELRIEQGWQTSACSDEATIVSAIAELLERQRSSPSHSAEDEDEAGGLRLEQVLFLLAGCLLATSNNSNALAVYRAKDLVRLLLQDQMIQAFQESAIKAAPKQEYYTLDQVMNLPGGGSAIK